MKASKLKKEKVKLFNKLIHGGTIPLSTFEVKLKNGQLFFKHHIDDSWSKFAISLESFLDVLGKKVK